jgi:hypothetical protein
MTSALEGHEWSAARPDCTLPRERPGTHCTGGWVGPRAGQEHKTAKIKITDSAKSLCSSWSYPYITLQHSKCDKLEGSVFSQAQITKHCIKLTYTITHGSNGRTENLGQFAYFARTEKATFVEKWPIQEDKSSFCVWQHSNEVQSLLRLK